MKKYAITSIVSIMLCFTLCFGVCATGIQSEDLVFTTVDRSEISDELLSVIKSSDSNSLIPVDIWFYETETEDIESRVKASVGVDKSAIANNYTRVNYSEEIIDRYIETERRMYREAQMVAHKDFIEKYKFSYIEDNVKSDPQTAVLLSQVNMHRL